MLKKIQVNVNELNSWNCYMQPNFKLFFSGYLLDYSIKDLESQINLLLKNKDFMNELKKFILGLRGHFALIINSKKFTFAAVDQVCSIPIFYMHSDKILYLSNQASLLTEEINREDLSINEDALLEIKMSGCTISEKTLVNGLFRLDAGNCVFFQKNSELRVLNYYKYWNDYNLAFSNDRDFDSIIRSVFSKYISYLDGRQVIVPLSGGYDSRLIVSLLYEFNYKNVICFTFGKKNSFEHQAAKKITTKLNYAWFPIYQTKKLIRKYIKSEHAKKYYKFCETFSNPPSMLDAFAIHDLLKKAPIEKDAVVINGNTGDFISGGHIPQDASFDSLMRGSNELGLDKNFLNRHFSLWESCRNSNNDKKMIANLNKLVTKYLNSNIPEYMIYETLEVLHRQSKLILSMQRVYEFNNLSWAIPFWDKEYINYWAKLPLENKLNSRHYREQLINLDYAGVWKKIPINNIKIPLFIRFIRTFFMIFFIFSSREKWKKFDKKWFYFFYEDTANIGLVNYRQIVTDKSGYRNALSWRALNYINRIKL
jgi:asparagine synthase (glutamine-hydrolysing)